MRKRSNPSKIIDMPKHIAEPVKKKWKLKGKPAILIMLVMIFGVVLLFNFYFNYSGGIGINPDGTTMQTKYLLSGPDPYYNMRAIRWTIQDGHYPLGLADPLLEYPMNIVRNAGSGVRPPLMNAMAIGFHIPLTLIMPDMDALGFSMQFLPALFGALLVFPVYYLGKELLNWKAGLIAAFFVAIIPIHLASGHGTAFTLFDHDALVLLIFAFIYLFYIRSIKSKSNLVGILYALLSGIAISAMIMLWVEAVYTYAVLFIFFVIQVIANILLKNHDMRFIRNTIIAWGSGYLIALPVNLVSWHFVFRADTCLVITGFAAALGIYCYIIKKLKTPWIVSLPVLGCLAAIGLLIIRFMPTMPLLAGFSDMARMLFGSGFYGSQTSLTIAEASTFNMSRWVMSFGPSLYLIALVCGLPYMLYRWFRTKRYDFFFILVWFIVTTYLNTIAGRFINDYIPLVAVLSALFVYLVVEKVNYKKMIKTIRDVGGLHGIRKGVRSYHVMGVLFIVFIVIMPNTYMAFDAAIPANSLQKFGKSDSTFGLSTYKELYWTEALAWLANQDTAIKDFSKRPGFISWWDYGFQEVAVGDHPTVADNYQRGIECAANFQTAASEKEAISVLIVLLLRADSINGTFTDETDAVIHKYLPDNKPNKDILNDILHRPLTIQNTTKTDAVVVQPAKNLENIIIDPITYAPSFNTFFGRYHITAMTALYHDSVSILRNLSEEQTVEMYQDLQKTTGFSIRYYGTEGYDMDIFNVFTFLAFKGTFGYATMNDNYYEETYTDKNNQTYTYADIQNLTQEQYNELQPFTPHQNVKDSFYQSMVVRSYRGNKNTFIPDYGLKHFIAEYISQLPYPGTHNPAVIISKYYPGGFINGSVFLGGAKIPGLTVAFLDKNDIPHDIEYSNAGDYSLVSLPGNFTLQYYVGTNIVKELKFNGTSAISETEANRTIPYSRTINVTIGFSNVSGYVPYGAGMTIGFTNEYYQTGETRSPIDKNGTYGIRNLIPSQYTVTIYSADKTIQSESFFAAPGNQTHNVSVTQGILYGNIDHSVGNMSLKLEELSLPITYNTTIRTYETKAMAVGNYTIGFYANSTSHDQIYNLSVTVVPGAKKFDIRVPS